MNDTVTLHVIALDVEGNSRELGDRTIHCHNEDGVNPFGAIDTPAQGGTASGKQYINFGWALTPPPSVIPTNGSTIGVYIDGQYKGHVVYNQWRPEIKTLFPSYLNNDGAGGYFVLDTTGYGDGLHTIGWAVQDNGGHVDGIGSRFFTIYNHAAGAYNPGAGLKTLGVTGLSVNRDGISVLKGFDRIAGVEWVYPNESGDCIIGVAPLERLEIDLNAGEFRCCSGYMEVGEEWRALPAGSVLDKEIGIFYWQVSPGFWGKYGLVFVGEKEYKTVQVWVEKRGQDRKGG